MRFTLHYPKPSQPIGGYHKKTSGMSDVTYQNFRIEEKEPIATLWLDVPNHAMNIFDDDVVNELSQLVEHYSERDEIKVIVFRSGKERGFLAGADINRIASIADAIEARSVIRFGQELFDRVEQLPQTTIAMIHGPCVGGGLEFALACNYRIVRDDGHTRLGLPEIQLGLIPAWGGTYRLPQRCGLSAALPLILKGNLIRVREAKRIGLVDVAVPPDDWQHAEEKFAKELLEGKEFRRADRRSLTTRLLDSTVPGRWLLLNLARRKTASQAEAYPALPAAINAIARGLRSHHDGLWMECEEFARLLFTRTSQNLQQIFFNRERAKNIHTWCRRNGPPADLQRVGVIGAGVMGAGIGQLAAFKGCEVVLKEIDQEAVQAGKQRIEKLFQQLVRRGRLHAEQAAQHLRRVQFTTEWTPLADVDLVIEAAVEKQSIKEDLFRHASGALRPGAILTTNTSSLRVGPLAEMTDRPDHVAGLHFFNPVHRMELVEVVRTLQTSDETIAALLQFVRMLGKTPVVTGDAPGFVVNRVLFPYLGEAVRMVHEGIGVKQIDSAIRDFGMPMGPLELLDQVGLDVAAHVASSLAPVLPDSQIVADRLQAMVAEGALGKKSGKGFYHYRGKRKRPRKFKVAKKATRFPFARSVDARDHLSHTQRRLIYPILNEAVRCLEQKIVSAPWIIDFAMVMGTGFAPYRGGPLRMVDDIGTRRLIKNMSRLSEVYGDRFRATRMLRDVGLMDGKIYLGEPDDSSQANHPAAH